METIVDVKDLRSEFGDRAIEIIVNGLNIQNYNERTKKGLCPFHSEKTPSFSWDSESNQFHCFGCGKTVNIIDYYIEVEYLSFIQATDKVLEMLGKPQSDKKPYVSQRKEDKEIYLKPKIDKQDLPEDMVKYFEKRKITEDTLNHWRVKKAIINFANKGQPDDYRPAIVFSCYDENNELVHESYRGSGKTFKQSYKTKSILWGQWHIDTNERLYVVEGQPDAMALWQSGIKNVVSIPSGAQNRKYLELNYDFLSQFDEIIFWIDNDEAGKTAGSNFKAKFDNVEILASDKYKDPNEMLIAEGEQAVYEFANRKPKLPKGIKSINQLAYGLDIISDEERIETGFYELDSHVRDWRLEQLSIIFGRDNEGKSTFVSQIIVHQLIKKNKTFLFSAELGEQGLQDWLFRQLIGNEKHCFTVRKDKYGDEFFIKPTVIKAIKKWAKDTLYVVDRKERDITKDSETLFATMKILATKFGVRLFVIDNLQSVLEENAASLYSDQSNFVENCRKFAILYKVHVILVAHPRKVDELKPDENTKTGNLEKNDISGSKNISNKAHNILSVERDFNGEFFDMILTNLKDKHRGIRAGYKFFFDSTTFRFYNNTTNRNVEPLWKECLDSDVDRNNYNKIKLKENLENSPFWE